MSREAVINSGISIAHVSSAHPWSDVRVHMREAASLASAGYNVTLIAVDNDVEVPSTAVSVIKLTPRPRVPRMTLGTLEAIWVALRTRAQVLHLHDPELVWAIPLLRALGRKVIYDAHEDLPAQTLHKTYLPRWATPLAVTVSRAVVRVGGTANLVVAATEPIARRYPSHKVTVVRNYPRARQVDRTLPSVEARPPAIAYVGALSVERGALVLLSALADSVFPATWRLVLAGPMEPGLQKRMEGMPGWERVDYAGVVSPDEARDLLVQSRVGICTLQRTPAYVESLPTKMFEYFAGGLPVVASDFPLWRDIVIPYDCGTLVDQTSPHALALAIAQYANNPELLAHHSRNAFMAAQTLNWASEEATLLEAYRALLNPGAENA